MSKREKRWDCINKTSDEKQNKMEDAWETVHVDASNEKHGDMTRQVKKEKSCKGHGIGTK